jgi:hypothetical protein
MAMLLETRRGNCAFHFKKRAHTDTTGKLFFFVDRGTKNGNQLNDKNTFFYNKIFEVVLHTEAGPSDCAV